MAAAMVLLRFHQSIGLVVGNQIASTSAASGPAIYNYTWLVLMLPFGMIGVTILTVVMPRLFRNAAAYYIPAVLADLALATRLTMITLIPTVAFMTVGGPAMGRALFAYGQFGEVDAGYLGAAIALSAFTLIPYCRGAAAVAGVLCPPAAVDPDRDHRRDHVGQDRRFAGGAAPHRQPRTGGRLSGRPTAWALWPARSPAISCCVTRLRPDGGHCSTVARCALSWSRPASLLAGWSPTSSTGCWAWTRSPHGGGRLAAAPAGARMIMVPIVAAVMVRGQVPEAVAALAVLRRWIGRAPAGRQALRSRASSRCRRAPFWQVSQRRRPCLRWHKSTVALWHRPVP